MCSYLNISCLRNDSFPPLHAHDRLFSPQCWIAVKQAAALQRLADKQQQILLLTLSASSSPPLGWRRRARFRLLSHTNSLCLLNTMFCCQVKMGKSDSPLWSFISATYLLDQHHPSFFSPSLFSCSVTWILPLSLISKGSCVKRPYPTITRCVKSDWGTSVPH